MKVLIVWTDGKTNEIKVNKAETLESLKAKANETTNHIEQVIIIK